MKNIAIVLICFCSTLAANAQLLWKIHGNGAKNESYIFGTHHVAPYSITDSVPGFNKALASVDLAIGEINLSNVDPNEVQQLTLQHALAPADSILTSVLLPEQIDSLNVVLNKYTQGLLSAEVLAAMKPVMVSTMITLYQTTAIFPNYNQNEQLDGMIMSRAQELGKNLDGFETIEEQLGFLFDSPISLQAAQLMDVVRNDAEAAEMTKSLAHAYMTQDLQKINEILSEGQEDNDEFSRTLVVDRNLSWVDKLRTLLPQKSVFIVVGCGHLPGENGLIQLLRNDGFTVEAVM